MPELKGLGIKMGMVPAVAQPVIRRVNEIGAMAGRQDEWGIDIMRLFQKGVHYCVGLPVLLFCFFSFLDGFPVFCFCGGRTLAWRARRLVQETYISYYLFLFTCFQRNNTAYKPITGGPFSAIAGDFGGKALRVRVEILFLFCSAFFVFLGCR